MSKVEITDEMVETAARAMCKRTGTAQCAAICLSRFASDNQDGKCTDAKLVHGRAASAALKAVAPMIAAQERERINAERMQALVEDLVTTGTVWLSATPDGGVEVLRPEQVNAPAEGSET